MSSVPLSRDDSPLNNSAAAVLRDALPPAVAIIPTFHGFEVKSAKQTNTRVPHWTIRSLWNGARVAPMEAFVVGLQIATQKRVESIIGCDSDTISSKLSSSAIVGMLTAPGHVILNGYTMGISTREALARTTVPQIGAIGVREAGFVGALVLSNPLSRAIETHLGKSELVSFVSTFSVGALGSAVGHAPDTYLTLLQKGLRPNSLSCLGRGGFVRAVSTGIYSTIYAKVERELE